MAIIEMEEIIYRNDLVNAYRFSLEDCSNDERIYYEKYIIKPAIARTCQKYKDQGIAINNDSINNNLSFYDDLFEDVCTTIISLDPTLGGASEEIKGQTLDYLLEQRESDKKRLFYDDDFFDEKPVLSDYEFDIPSILKDVQKYKRNAINTRKHSSK